MRIRPPPWRKCPGPSRRRGPSCGGPGAASAGFLSWAASAAGGTAAPHSSAAKGRLRATCLPRRVMRPPGREARDVRARRGYRTGPTGASQPAGAVGAPECLVHDVRLAQFRVLRGAVPAAALLVAPDPEAVDRPVGAAL